MRMETADCKTAGQLLSGAASPLVNHYNHVGGGTASTLMRVCVCVKLTFAQLDPDWLQFMINTVVTPTNITVV